MRIYNVIFLCIIFFYGHAFAQNENPYNEIRFLIGKGEFEKAKFSIENALKKNSEDSELHFLLGYTYLKLIDEVSIFKKRSYANNGRKSLEKTISLDPSHVKAYKELSDFFTYAPSVVGGNREKALQLIDQVGTFDPYHHLMFKGDFYVAEEQTEKALTYFGQAMKAFPDSLLPIVKVGFYLRETGKYESSIEAFQRALEVDPGYYLSHYHIGAAGLEGGIRSEESIQSFQKYIELAVKEDAEFVEHAWYRIGLIYASQGDKIVAKASYQKALSFDPKYEPALNALEKLD